MTGAPRKGAGPTRPVGRSDDPGPPWVEVVIEVPRWSFLKRGSNGRVDFVSPLPCPFNYGSVPGLLGQEGDLLDALVLGPRLGRGSRLRVRAYGAVGLRDRGLYDDKLICALEPPSIGQRRAVEAFFRLYGRAKAGLNLMRGQTGQTESLGWGDAHLALSAARPVRPGDRREPVIRY